MDIMERLKELLHSYHPIVWVLLIGTVFARLASTMAMPFIAIYLATTLDSNPILIGLTIGMGPLAGTVGGFIGGNLSDRYGRKVIMLISIFAWSAVFLGFALSNSVAWFIILNSLNGLCRSFFEPASQALMADLTAKDKRMNVYSMRYLAINIGAAGGPILGAYFALQSANLTFFITAFSYTIYGLCLLVLMNKFALPGQVAEKRVTFLDAIQVIKTDIPLRYFIIGGMITGLGYSQIESTLPQHLSNSIVDGVVLYSILLSVNAVMVILLQLPLTHITRNLSIMKVIMIGAIFFALGYVGFGLFNSWTGIIIAMIILTIGEILVFPSGSMFIDQIAPDHLRGTYFGANSFRSVGSFVGPMLGGFLLKSVGGNNMFMVIAVIVASSILFYYVGYQQFMKKQQSIAVTPETAKA
jgi:MFS family permease